MSFVCYFIAFCPYTYQFNLSAYLGFIFSKDFFITLTERESKCMGGETEGKILQADSPPTMRSWSEPKPRVRHSTAWVTQAPLDTEVFKIIYFWPLMGRYVHLSWEYLCPQEEVSFLWPIHKMSLNTRHIQVFPPPERWQEGVERVQKTSPCSEEIATISLAWQGSNRRRSF